MASFPTLSSSEATAAFELPAMPGSYEDFDFSLDLPENITSSDFNLVASPGFGDLFGASSASSASLGPFGISSLSSSMILSPDLASTSMSWSSTPSQTTPRLSSMVDRGGDGDALGLGFTAGQLTAAPMEAADTASSGPLPPPYSPPEGNILHKLDEDTAQRHPQHTSFSPHALSGSLQTSLSESIPTQPQRFGQPSIDAGSLFNASESNFLTSFLSSFDGFDFNPTLPADMPSFISAVEKGAASSTIGETTMVRQRKRNGPISNSATSPSKSTSSGATPTAGAAFGQGLENLTDEEEDSEAYDDDTLKARRKRVDPSASHSASVMDVFPHIRQQQQLHRDSQLYDQTHRSFRKEAVGMHNGATSDGPRSNASIATNGNGKKMKTEHGVSTLTSTDGAPQSHHRRPSHYAANVSPQQSSSAAAAAAAAAKRDLLSEGEKRQNHILSEQRRRNHIREAFKELVDLLEAGREFGARGLGLSSGAGTGIEDEGLDDRSDYESTLEDEEASAASKRRKAKAKRATAVAAEAAAAAAAAAREEPNLGSSADAYSAFAARGAASIRGRGKGRGRGGSAGGGAGSKSAVLFQAVDLLMWLQGRNERLEKHVKILEHAVTGASLNDS